MLKIYCGFSQPHIQTQLLVVINITTVMPILLCFLIVKHFLLSWHHIWVTYYLVQRGSNINTRLDYSYYKEKRNLKLMKQNRTLINHTASLDLDYQKYRSRALNPLVPSKGHFSDELLQTKAKQIFQWARKNGALYYTFFAYPSTQGVLEKQQTFLDLDYFFKQNLASSGKSAFTFQQLRKGEGDGSSFPSGGLRVTHKARAYTVWDTKSEVFLRQNNVLYIPSLLVTHDGQALDDKTLFRKAEKVLESNTISLLSKLGINATAVVMALGLQQQFFVLKKQVVDKRLDMRSTGRALVGVLPPKHQQFSDHYYGKLPEKIQKIFKQAQQQLLSIGVPCKTRHKEVAPNQFQMCPLFEQAGKAIDHNMILMEILKQKFSNEGLTAMFHEKPFSHLNGSGKHCNWSLNFVDADGSLYNLFGVPKDQSNYNLFKLFILIQLRALLKNSKLYLSSVSGPGNQLRLGGHEAPPRIMSAFLGDTVSSIVDDTFVRAKGNLKNQLPNLPFDLLQEDTDRNRTSPFAYTGNKFEFRAVGSSQNVCFPMAVIAATMAQSIKQVCQRLDSGVSLQNIISDLRQETQAIRFNGNGYSKQWVEEAKSRGLYVNEKFFQNIDNIKQAGKIFVDMEICKEKQLDAKYENFKCNYRNTVQTQKDCLLHMLGSQIVPRCYEYMRLVQPRTTSQRVNKRTQLFMKTFENLLQKQEQLMEWKSEKSIENAYQLRKLITETCERTNKVLLLLPKHKDFPEFEDFMHQY